VKVSSRERLTALVEGIPGPELEPQDLDDCADDAFEAAWELMLAARHQADPEPDQFDATHALLLKRRADAYLGR
jgi:hypothetical protein